MSKVTPAKPRATVRSVPGGLEISAAPRRQIGAVLFLPVWLVGWAFGETFAIGALLGGAGRSSHGPPTLFLAAWLVLWTVGGAAAAWAFLYTAFGREVVTLAGGELRVRRAAAGLGRTRVFDAAQVTDLRVSPLAPARNGFEPFSPGGTGTVAFDYGARTYRILAAVEEAEAKGLVEALAARLPASRRAGGFTGSR